MLLKQANIWLRQALPQDESKREAELLLQQLLQVNRAYLMTHEERILTSEEVAQLQAWVKARQAGKPLAYLLGETEFYGLRLTVNPSVLIPRADTELLVDLALASLQALPATTDPIFLLDMGTGSGAVAIAIAANAPLCRVTALDVSETALAVASTNAQRHGFNIHFQQSHWFDQLPQQRFQIIVSNPPYIAEEDEHLTQTSLPFEPRLALTSGKDGLNALRHIIAQSRYWLQDQGELLLEHGYDQAEAVQALLRDHMFTHIRTSKDLGGKDRVTQGKLQG